MSKELDYLDKILNYQPLTLVERTIIECIKEKIQRLEAIDNSNSSEVLVYIDAFIEENSNDIKNQDTTGFDIDTQAKWVKYLEHKSFMLNTIKQALLKQQEPKQYLKWEDLEWEELQTITKKDIKVNLNGVEYGLEFAINYGTKEVIIFDEKEFLYAVFNEYHKQFFNDLHLERVEE